MDTVLPLIQSTLTFAMDAPRLAWTLLTPPPITPYFQQGGPLEGYNEDVAQLLGSVALCAVLDFLLVRPFIVPKARYFALHAICNALVCVAAFKGTYRVFTDDPLWVFYGPSDSTLCNSIVAGLHLYHCLAFSLSADDIFHHLTFCASLCLMAVPVKQWTGASVPFGAFFLSGLPGGIDYLMLTLSAHGIVSKDFQKNLYQKLNVWMRAPAMTLYAFMCFVGSIHGGNHPVPIPLTIASVALHYYNGQFYAQQSIEANAIYRYKKQLAAMGVDAPDIRLSDLHKPLRSMESPEAGEQSGDSAKARAGTNSPKSRLG